MQYVPPSIELLADANGDGVLEPVDFLQPLGVSEAPAVDGNRPPYLAWLRTRVLGVPDGVDQITVKVEGLGAGGAPAPDRPSPLLPSSAEITLYRRPGLKLSDPGRHTFTSSRPILLIADERARSDNWQHLTDEQRQKLTDESGISKGIYPLCRNCARDLDGDDEQDIPYGFAAPLAASTPAAGPEPVEIAASGLIRFTLAPPEGSTWLGRLEEADMLPRGIVHSIHWAPSPPLGSEPGLSVPAPAAPEIDLAEGAVRLDRTDLSLSAPGLSVSAGRTYHSGGIHSGLFGPGWELAGVSRLRPNPDGTVDFYTADGSRYVFANTAGHPGAGASVFTARGIPSELRKKNDGSWFLLHSDGSYSEYAANGRLIRVRGRFRKSPDTGSELLYDWNPDGTLASIRQINGLHTTDIRPKSLVFRYLENDEGSSLGLIRGITDAAGRTREYRYDAHGRLKDSRIRNLLLAPGGTVADHFETYAYRLTDPGPAGVETLETFTQLDRVTDAENNTVLSLEWTDTAAGLKTATSITRGAGADAVTLAIDYFGEKTWKITEGPGGPSPTVTEINLAPAKSGDQWIRTVTLGQGPDALTTTTVLDRDGRVLWTTDPAGVTVRTEYRQDVDRRLSFAPVSVTTTKGSVGEDRPETPAILVTTYEYFDSSSNLPRLIARPGPRGPLVTTYEREGTHYPTVVIGPDGVRTTRSFDVLGRPIETFASSGALTSLEYDDAVRGTGDIAKTTVTSASGISVTTLDRDAAGFVVSTRTTVPGRPEQITRTTPNLLGWTLESVRGTTRTGTAYDAAGRIASITSGPANGPHTTTVPTYTSSGMIASITRAEGALSEETAMT